MNIIFLDCDGVLNNEYTKARCGNYVGIDSALVKNLKKIVDATDAVLVLSSTWRLGYNKDHQQLEHHAKYLKNKLDKQHLRILGMTSDLGRRGIFRGAEIHQWLENNADIVDNWVVLDDEWFGDFAQYDIVDHLVSTDFYGENGGLQEEHVQQAIKILNGELNNEE